MRFSWLPLLLGVSLFVSACGQTPVAADDSTPVEKTEIVSTVQSLDGVVSSQTDEAELPPSVEPTNEIASGNSVAEPTCEIAPTIPIADPKLTTKIPPVTDNDWILGEKDAKITLMEYSDYQCPYCAQFSPVLQAFIEKNPADVRLVVRHFPLPGHPLSLLATQAAESAGLQGKFWEMHDVIFENQQSWDAFDETAFESWLIEKADVLGLDTGQFTTDLTSQAMMDKAIKAQVDAIAADINQTPYLLLNGFPAPYDEDKLQMIVDLMKSGVKEFTECPPFTVDSSRKYAAVIKTEKGDIKLDLYPDKAPWAVNSFIFLAKAGWYDNNSFYRVLPGIVALSGDPTNTGLGGPGYTYDAEFSDLKFDAEGMVGVEKISPTKNGSRFFITMEKVPQLDGELTLIGRVTEGMDVVKNLTPRDTLKGTEIIPEGDKILGITIIE